MSKPSWLSNKFVLVVVWIIAIAVRLYGATRPSQYYDMGTFEAWSRSFWVHGPQAFFSSVWSDYLPLPILSFAPISLLADFCHAPFGLVFKLIHLFLELILILFISKSTRYDLRFTALLLLSPVLIGDTSFWGQVDTIPALLALLSLTTIYPLPSSILFGLAVAYKPIMVLIAPILWIKDMRQGHWFRFPLISASVFFLTGIPTGGLNFITHLISRALEQSGTYPFLTINAFNFWSLVPNISWIPDSTSVLGLSGKTFGLILFIVLVVISLNNWRRVNFNIKYVPRIAATIMITFFAFTTRMHERHLLFGLPFLALATLAQPWLLTPLFLLTVTFTLNLWGAFYWVAHNQTWPFGASIISLISWVTTLTSLAIATIWSWPDFLRSIIRTLRSHKLLLSVLIIASVLRFGNLTYPSTYIFDEVYHAFTAREYLHNHIEAWEWWTTPPKDVAYEWTHPPFAKYGMVAGMLLFGENSFGWRVGSALFGVVSILGIYLLVLALTKKKQVALIAAFMVSIEGTHIAESRIAMNDIYMLCFFIWSLYLAVKSRWKFAAILYGFALASKWSALYGLIPLASIYFQQNISAVHDLRSAIYHLATPIRLIFIAIAVYVLTFAPFILAGHTWAQWWELHRQMWYYHTHLVATHGYQSTPLQWIFDVRPVWYYVQYLTTSISNIYVIGNPIILWLGLGAFIFQLNKLRYFPNLLFSLTYIIFTAPWVFSPRIMFYYHYLPSATFLCIILATWLSIVTPRYRYLVLAICVIGLLIISPMLYGFDMPHSYWDTLFKIVPSWK